MLKMEPEIGYTVQLPTYLLTKDKAWFLNLVVSGNCISYTIELSLLIHSSYVPNAITDAS